MVVSGGEWWLVVKVRNLGKDHLRSQVVWSATEGERCSLGSLGKSKVRHLTNQNKQSNNLRLF